MAYNYGGQSQYGQYNPVPQPQYGNQYSGGYQQQSQTQQYGGGHYNNSAYSPGSSQYAGDATSPQYGAQGQQQGFGAPPPPPPPPPRSSTNPPVTSGGYGGGYDYYNSQQSHQGSPGYDYYNSQQSHQGGPGYQPLQPAQYQTRDLSGLSPGSSPQSTGQYRNSYSPGGQALYAMKKEFFVSATLDEFDRHENASNAAKAQGRAKFGRAGSLLGSMAAGAESMLGGQTHMVPDSVVAQETSDAIIDETTRLMKKKGWACLITPVRMPQPGGSPQDKAQFYMTVGEHGLFMMFRVMTMQRLPEGNTETDGGWAQRMTRCFENCCAPEAPSFSRTSGNAGKFAHKVEIAMKERPTPLVAHIDVGDAEDMVKALRNKGWAPEMATQVVLGSRQNGPMDGMGMGHNNSNVMYGS